MSDEPGGPVGLMPETQRADPLTVRCPYLYCRAPEGIPCTRYSESAPWPPARRPHKARVKLALMRADVAPDSIGTLESEAR